MPPKEAKEDKVKGPKKRVGTIKKKFETRSKSADATRRNIVSRGINVVSRSLPSLNRIKVKGEVIPEGEKQQPNEGKKKKKRRRRRRRSKDGSTVASEHQSEPLIVVRKEENHRKTIWKHVALLGLLFAYSLLGGLVFSAIEGGYDQQQLLARYERSVDLFRRRKNYQHMIYRRFKDIDEVIFKTRPGQSIEDLRLEMVREALSWYEKKIGVTISIPSIENSRWNLWGGVYYAASLYTTIGQYNIMTI
uniref:Twk-24 n=1 Tax=Pristionchus pacificus TaxID=54126 RepID=A0A2A6CR92_PRIPA|eukprot:PDM80577.1 twk-24 [Pristionchus pacificus]